MDVKNIYGKLLLNQQTRKHHRDLSYHLINFIIVKVFIICEKNIYISISIR